MGDSKKKQIIKPREKGKITQQRMQAIAMD